MHNPNLHIWSACYLPTTVNRSLRLLEGPWRSFRVIVPEVVGVQVISTDPPAARGVDLSGLLIGFSRARTALARAAMAKRELVKKRIVVERCY